MGNLFIKFVRIVNKAAEIVVLNIMFLLCCVPVVTMGQAWCALFCAIRYRLRGDKWWDGFKAGLKQNFFRGVLVWTLGILVILSTTLLCLPIFLEQCDWFSVIFSCAVSLVFAVYLAAMIPLHVYLPTTFGNWIKNASYVMRRAPYAPLLIAIMMWLPFALFLVNYPLWYHLLIVFITVYDAFVALIGTFLMRRSLLELHDLEELEAEEKSQ
ncbi:MAG: DUF624 domain-containing protein [Oscillospiraceae bacterium]|nr:DUF624 domain-containing protein [Oscillospiraceae bacterium]